MKLAHLLPAALLTTLAPFQKEGIAMIIQNEGRTMV
jgi:hypothetical protein